MRNKFYFSGIAAAVGTAVRQWIFGKSKAGADGGGGFGLASELEEQEETGGSRIALLILLASLTTLALWAYDGYDGCYVWRYQNCTESRTLCIPAITDESSPFWRPYDLELVWESTSTYSTCDTADPGELGYTECDPYEGTCQYKFKQIRHAPSSNCSNSRGVASVVTETKNVTTGYAWGNCCPHPW